MGSYVYVTIGVASMVVVNQPQETHGMSVADMIRQITAALNGRMSMCVCTRMKVVQ